jgi:hypothetical protein
LLWAVILPTDSDCMIWQVTFVSGWQIGKIKIVIRIVPGKTPKVQKMVNSKSSGVGVGIPVPVALMFFAGMRCLQTGWTLMLGFGVSKIIKRKECSN